MLKANLHGGDRHAPAWLSRLLLVALGLAILTVTISSYIRLAESGLGCDDWPSCFGQYHYNESAQGINVLMEKGEHSPHRMVRVAHRLVTSTLGAIILFVFITSWRPAYRGILGRLVPTSLLLLTVILASIGRIHPVQPLPILTLSNFVGGLLLVVLIFYLYLRTTLFPDSAIKTKMSPLLRLGMLIVALQILLGGWTSANYAGASCDGLFACQTSEQENIGIVEALLPVQALLLDGNKQVVIGAKMPVIQLAHHVLALFTLLYFVFLVVVLMRSERRLYNPCLLVLAMLILQCLLGLTALAFQLPLVIISIHNLLAALLLISVTSLNMKTTSRVLL